MLIELAVLRQIHIGEKNKNPHASASMKLLDVLCKIVFPEHERVFKLYILYVYIYFNKFK